MTSTSGRMASRFLTVSMSVSPLETEEPEAVQLSASAESTLAAISKELRVRVEASKKRLTMERAAQRRHLLDGPPQHLLHGDRQVEDLGDLLPRVVLQRDAVLLSSDHLPLLLTVHGVLGGPLLAAA